MHGHALKAIPVVLAALLLALPAQAAAKPRLTKDQAIQIFVAYDKVADWLTRYPPKPTTDATFRTGWKIRKGGVSLEGLTESPEKRFKVMDEKIVIDYKVKTDMWIDTVKSYGADLIQYGQFLAGDIGHTAA